MAIYSFEDFIHFLNCKLLKDQLKNYHGNIMYSIINSKYGRSNSIVE